MTPELGREMARYNRWMNEKLYALSAELSDEERKRDRGAFFKSIHLTLNHLLLADRLWLGRLAPLLEQRHVGNGMLEAELYSNFDELRRERAATDADLEQWASTFTSEALAANVRYVRRGVTHEEPLWQPAAHMFNHQTHHRGQVTTLLFQAGKDPGVTDLMALLREPAQERARGAV